MTDPGTLLRRRLRARDRSHLLAVPCLVLALAGAACALSEWQMRANFACVLAPCSSFAHGPFRIADTNSYSISGTAYEAADSPHDLGNGKSVRGFQVGEGGGVVTFNFPGHAEEWDVLPGWWVYVYSDANGVFRVVIDNGGPL